ncbi:MAG: hypothetical protein ABGZ53_03215 [Fuerstiella sp.]
MNNLLRMSLFIIARAGLFLAVVAWIAGQWWEFGCSADVQGGSLIGSIAPRGWVVGHYDEPLGWSCESMLLTDYDDPDNARSFFELNPDDFECRFVAMLLPGVSYVRFYGPAFGFRHWLIVTLFTAFNIARHFIYRKRPEGMPCEV